MAMALAAAGAAHSPLLLVKAQYPSTAAHGLLLSSEACGKPEQACCRLIGFAAAVPEQVHAAALPQMHLLCLFGGGFCILLRSQA